MPADGFEPLLVRHKTAKFTASEFATYTELIQGSPPGWFVVSDREPLTQYVKLLTRIAKTQDKVDKLRSEIVDTSHGPQTHPSVRLLDLYQRRASQLREELRINPASRNKAQRLTRLGTARAQKAQGASDVAATAADVVPSRDGLMWGGARAAALLAADDDKH